jgi:hypothetical protein
MPKRKGADDSAEDDFSAGASDQHESDAASTSEEEVPVKSKKKVLCFLVISRASITPNGNIAG